MMGMERHRMVVGIMHFPKDEVGVRIGCIDDETVRVRSRRGLHQRTSEESCCHERRRIGPGRLWIVEWMHWEASRLIDRPPRLGSVCSWDRREEQNGEQAYPHDPTFLFLFSCQSAEDAPDSRAARAASRPSFA